jgi:hypothetical protein
MDPSVVRATSYLSPDTKVGPFVLQERIGAGSFGDIHIGTFFLALAFFALFLALALFFAFALSFAPFFSAFFL